MSQFQTYKDRMLEPTLVRIEQELIKLKSIQHYSPSEINYSYQSNTLGVHSYNRGGWETAEGVIASLLFTSHFPDIFPRVSLVFYGVGDDGSSPGALMDLRYEKVSANTVRIYVNTIDSPVPMSAPVPFTANFYVYSNVNGILSLEKTYVIPTDPGYSG